MNENTKFTLQFLGGGLLLTILGLGLAIGVGGWLSVVGGGVLALAGLYLVAIWLFGTGFSGR